MPSLSIKPVLAEAPSLGNAILCVARGETDKGTKIYFYTSVIDNASIQRKRPVAVTIVESVTDIAEGDVVIIDKEHQSITIDAFGAATPPQMQPVGLALILGFATNLDEVQTACLQTRVLD